MKKQLVEGTPREGWITFFFNDYDDSDDFTKIIQIIRQLIQPTKLYYNGLEDMNGYFIKDDIRVELEYDTMLGNMIEWKNDGHIENRKKVRKWVKTIWEALETGDE